MPTYTRPGMQRFRSRLTVSDEAEGLRIWTPPPRDWAVLVIVVWLGLWTFLGAQSWRNHSSLFVAAWGFAELWAIYAILDNVGGNEIILANSEALTRMRRIFGLGWSKTYPISEIRNLRFQRGSGRRPSRIALDHGAWTVRFAAGIGESEAYELMGKIRQRCAIADDPL